MIGLHCDGDVYVRAERKREGNRMEREEEGGRGGWAKRRMEGEEEEGRGRQRERRMEGEEG